MKNFISILSILFLSVIMFQCKEVETPVVTNPSQITLFDTIYVSTDNISPVQKRILMEEFSGVKCANCPQGNEKTHDILAANQENVIVVTVHSNFLADPYPNNPDFRNQDANDLSLAPLGPVPGKPGTYINRKIFAGNSEIVIQDLNTWEGFANQELALTTPVSMELEKVFVDVEERKFRYKVRLEFAQDMDDLNLGFLLTESDIEAEQLNGSIHVHDYIHEFVLRGFITSIFGESISAQTIQANTVIVKEFEIDLDDADYNPAADWILENMELVAFVRSNNNEILNSVKLELN